MNTRLAERDIGHQLHFDTEAETIRTTGRVLHPGQDVSLYQEINKGRIQPRQTEERLDLIVGSVSYLLGEHGGPTIVLDQTVDGPEAQRAWLVRPRPRAVMMFPGDRLHGVLPARSDPTAIGTPDGARPSHPLAMEASGPLSASNL